MTTAIARAQRPWVGVGTLRGLDRIGAVAGIVAIISCVVLPSPRVPTMFAQSHAIGDREDENAAVNVTRAKLAERVRYRGDEVLVAAYAGTPYTYASDLRIEADGTDMTAHDVDWRGKPFNAPIYYGARAIRWFPNSSFGGMIDFTHSKAYAPRDQMTKLSGAKDGKTLPSAARIGNLFHKLEFTHGHNMLTLNVMHRLPSFGAFFSPYVGFGLGAALPHTEVQIKGAGGRTYEYQYVGPAGQLLIGIEIRVPRLSYFFEYKFTSASYRAPLQNRDGGALPLDLWNQFQRWLSGKPPEGGWASTWLTSHQIIGGMGIRTIPAVAKP